MTFINTFHNKFQTSLGSNTPEKYFLNEKIIPVFKIVLVNNGHYVC